VAGAANPAVDPLLGRTGRVLTSPLDPRLLLGIVPAGTEARPTVRCEPALQRLVGGPVVASDAQIARLRDLYVARPH
jgi:hypothetical protein